MFNVINTHTYAALSVFRALFLIHLSLGTFLWGSVKHLHLTDEETQTEVKLLSQIYSQVSGIAEIQTQAIWLQSLNPISRAVLNKPNLPPFLSTSIWISGVPEEANIPN